MRIRKGQINYLSFYIQKPKKGEIQNKRKEIINPKITEIENGQTI